MTLTLEGAPVAPSRDVKSRCIQNRAAREDWEMVTPASPDGGRVEALSRLSGRCRLHSRVDLWLGLPPGAERPQDRSPSGPEVREVEFCAHHLHAFEEVDKRLRGLGWAPAVHGNPVPVAPA